MANLAHSGAALQSIDFSRNQPAQHFRSWALAVVLLAATIFLLRLGDRSFWGSECWGEITREMQLTSELSPVPSGPHSVAISKI